MKNKINWKEVKSIIDMADWDFTFSGNPGSDVEKAIFYLDRQKFSINKIKSFEHYAEGETDSLEVAMHIADPLAWDRISRYVWTEGRYSRKSWAVNDTVNFNILLVNY